MIDCWQCTHSRVIQHVGSNLIFKCDNFEDGDLEGLRLQRYIDGCEDYAPLPGAPVVKMADGIRVIRIRRVEAV